MQIEYRARKVKEQEMKDLKKKYGEKRAKEIAEANFLMRIEEFQRREFEEEKHKQEILQRNRARYLRISDTCPLTGHLKLFEKGTFGVVLIW